MAEQILHAFFNYLYSFEYFFLRFDFDDPDHGPDHRTLMVHCPKWTIKRKIKRHLDSKDTWSTDRMYGNKITVIKCTKPKEFYEKLFEHLEDAVGISDATNREFVLNIWGDVGVY
jgi:hypothetical protein